MDEVLVLLLAAGVLWAHIKLRERDQPAGTGNQGQAVPVAPEGHAVAEAEEGADRGKAGQEAEAPASPGVAEQLPSADLEAVVRESGWFVDPLPEWLVPALKESTTVQVRNTGEPLDKESKKELGVNPNAKLGWDYVNALTEKGQSEQPLEAPKILSQRASHRQSRKEELERAEQLQSASNTVTVKVSAAGDEADCDAVKDITGREYALETVPVLPLADCDASYCRCAYAISAE